MVKPRIFSGNGRTATIADPNNITRDECLALAKCGVEAWNDWREGFGVRGRYPGPYKNFADFSSQDFSSESTDFSGFKFGHYAEFSDAKFWNAFFAGAEFGHEARFIGTKFEGRTCFDGARFGLEACFRRSEFGPDASLSECEFDSRASFQSARFGDSFNCRGSVFGDGAEFDWAHFDQFVSFQGALFLGSASFVAVSVGAPADFSGLMVSAALSFEAANFTGQTTFQGLSWGALKQELQLGEGRSALQVRADEWHASPWVFKAVNFRGATFGGSVDFSDRHFEGATEFSKTHSDTEALGFSRLDEPLASHVSHELVATEFGRMYLPKGRAVRFAWAPDFFQCRFHQNTSFDGASFPAADGSEDAARAYRVLKLAFSEQQATREEQRFFKLEMQEEAASENGWKRWLYSAYEITSDFGFSVWRPLVTLVLLPALVGMFLYLLCMSFHHPKLWLSALAQDSALTSEWLQFSFANMAPLPDGELLKDLREALFGSNTYAAVIALKLETLQKVLALAGYFLFGLALRNLFKMK